LGIWTTMYLGHGGMVSAYRCQFHLHFTNFLLIFWRQKISNPKRSFVILAQNVGVKCWWNRLLVMTLPPQKKQRFNKTMISLWELECWPLFKNLGNHKTMFYVNNGQKLQNSGKRIANVPTYKWSVWTVKIKFDKLWICK